jgi:hypothetical protein
VFWPAAGTGTVTSASAATSKTILGIGIRRANPGLEATNARDTLTLSRGT